MSARSLHIVVIVSQLSSIITHTDHNTHSLYFVLSIVLYKRIHKTLKDHEPSTPPNHNQNVDRRLFPMMKGHEGGYGRTSTTTTTAASPAGRTLKDDVRRIKQREREAREAAVAAGVAAVPATSAGGSPPRTTTIVPNLAEIMGGDGDGGGGGSGGGGGGGAMTCSYVPNLAALQSPGPGAAAIGPSQPYQAQYPQQQPQTPPRTTSYVPNLAAELGDDVPSRWSPAGLGTAGTVQEGRARLSNAAGGGAAGRISAAAAKTTRPSPRQEEEEEEDRASKEREKQHRTGGAGTFDPPMARPVPDGVDLQQSMMARYEAVGLVFGDDGDTFAIGGTMEDPAGSTTTASSLPRNGPGSKHDDTPLQQSSHLPASEDAVRERLRAAGLALGGSLTIEEEEQHLKQREREEREFLESSCHGSLSTSLNPDTKLAARNGVSSNDSRSTGQLRPDAEMKAHARATSTAASGMQYGSGPGLSTSQHDAKDRARASKAASPESSPGEMDATAKSRGRSSRESGAATVRSERSGIVDETAPLASVATSAPRPPVEVVPGAMAVSQGQAERRVKLSLTEQPEMMELGSMTIPIASASTSTLKATIPEELDEEAVLGLEQSVSDYNAPGSSGAPVAEMDPKDAESKPTNKSNRWKWIVGVLLLAGVAAGVGAGLAASAPNQQGAATVVPTTAPGTFESERFTSVKAELADVVTPLSVLEDSSSPQYEALRWAADEDTNTRLNDAAALQNRYILAVFYFSLGGPSWLDGFSAWLDTDSNECTWDGVECNNDGLVSSIVLDTPLNIVGVIPEEILHMIDLRKCFDGLGRCGLRSRL